MTIQEEIKALTSSSVYRFGDRLCFQVPLGPNLSLPGRQDPSLYITGVTGGRALVVCPGNGGMVAQLLLQGVEEVVALEPRVRFHDGLKAVLAMFDKVTPGKKHSTLQAFPKKGEANTLGQFDHIVWFEGMDDVADPAAVLTVVGTLKAGGKMLAEIQHGASTQLVGKVGLWLPAADVWLKHVTSTGALCAAPRAGRLATSKTYTITKPATPAPIVVPAEAAAPEPIMSAVSVQAVVDQICADPELDDVSPVVSQPVSAPVPAAPKTVSGNTQRPAGVTTRPVATAPKSVTSVEPRSDAKQQQKPVDLRKKS